VVTDLMMPVMDGHHLIAALRSDPSTALIPVLATTAQINNASSGADAVLTKPFDPDELLRTARTLTGVGG
jgi:CheY-like chemotaxis protein